MARKKVIISEINDTNASWSYAELWDKFPVPARPGKTELAIYEKAIKAKQKQRKEKKLLILGSTIEYRSLCKKLGIIPYVVDFSKENFDSLTGYSKENFKKEHFIKADWLKIKDKNKYDFILGHRPANVIRHDQVGKLFGTMYRALKPGGIFFCRGNVKFPGDLDKLKKLVNKWAFAKNRNYPLFTYLEVELYFHCAGKNGYLSYPKARAVMKKFFEQEKILLKDYRLIKPLISMPAGTKFRGLIKKNELDKVFKKLAFSRIEWLFTPEEFNRNVPIIKLTK